MTQRTLSVDYDNYDQWVVAMAEVGVNNFYKEVEEGFPDMLIYAIKGKRYDIRLIGTWNENTNTGRKYSSAGKTEGLMFDRRKRNLIKANKV